MIRKAKVKCSVVHCENTTFNSPHLQFYRFPTSNPLFPHKSERRKIWLTAVRRQGPDKSTWQPTKNQRICGEHFVGDKKSEDPRSPSYNPTIFPVEINAVVATRRYQLKTKKEQRTEIFKESKSSDREVQVDFLQDSVNRQDIFICNRFMYLNKCDAETQAYRSMVIKYETKVAKQTKDQEVQTDILLRETLKTEEIEIKVEDLHHSINIKEEPSILEYQPEPNGKLFTCAFCGYQFTRSHDLKLHLRIHTGQKPYTCGICNYKCARKGNLQAHIIIHTGEKPFACEFCNFKCARTGTLKIHVRTHTGEKPFTCKLCDYKSARKDTFQLHLRTHSLEKPFTCEVSSQNRRF